MTAEDYRQALASAVKEYEGLGQQRRDIDDRLAQLAQTIGTLSRLLGLIPTVPMGLTEACRLVLRGARVPMTPVEVRDRLTGIGVDLSIYSNELAVIHTVLKRLNDAGEIRFIAAPGKHLYRWAHLPRVVTIAPEVAELIRGADDTRRAPARSQKRVARTTK